MPVSSATSTRGMRILPLSTSTSTTVATYVRKLRCTAIPSARPLPGFFLAQPDCSATISITRRMRAVSSGKDRDLCGPFGGRRSIMRGVADHVEQIFDAIAPGRGRQFIGERLHGEGVRNVGHRSHPADAHLRFAGPHFGAEVRNIEGNVVPAHAQLEGAVTWP